MTMGDVMSKMFTYAGMSTALLAVIAIHLFLWWQAIRAIVIRTRRTYEAVVIQRALNEYFARKNSRKKFLESIRGLGVEIEPPKEIDNGMELQDADEVIREARNG